MNTWLMLGAAEGHIVCDTLLSPRFIILTPSTYVRCPYTHPSCDVRDPHLPPLLTLQRRYGLQNEVPLVLSSSMKTLMPASQMTLQNACTRSEHMRPLFSRRYSVSLPGKIPSIKSKLTVSGRRCLVTSLRPTKPAIFQGTPLFVAPF